MSKIIELARTYYEFLNHTLYEDNKTMLKREFEELSQEEVIDLYYSAKDEIQFGTKFKSWVF